MREMKMVLNGNGNGHTSHASIHPVKKKAMKLKTGSPQPGVEESRVTFKTSDGVLLHGAPTRITQHTTVFELYNPSITPRLSEALKEFEITLQGHPVYSGGAIICNVLDAGTKVVCEATLREVDWANPTPAAGWQHDGSIVKEFKGFLNNWQKLYKVEPEFKVIIADMQTFLYDLRLWLEQVELRIRTLPVEARLEQERAEVRQLEPVIVPAIRNFFERFEYLSNRVDDDLRPAHYAFGVRQILPLLLCSPFVHRTYNKPLGYPGDYEMVNMMFRDPFEGGSLFAKMINLYALQLPPIVGHRNRIGYLVGKLKEESLRGAIDNRAIRIFNLGCGPAHEIQRFLTDEALADHADFTLADFNQETIDHTALILNSLKQHHKRKGKINVVRRTVHQLLKDGERISKYAKHDQYDLIYCAGLFDYLSNQVCRQLMDVFYKMLLPGGLLIATNVDDHPAQNQMECFLEWHLVHRDEEKMRTIIPRESEPQNVSIKRDKTGVNVFLEVRKSSGEE